MADPVSREDYELVKFLEVCFHALAVTEEEVNVVLLALLWEREQDPPLWAAEIIDYEEKGRSTFSGFLKSRYFDRVFSKDQLNAIVAISVLRREAPESPDEPGRHKQLFAAYRRHPQIVARFRTLFPDATWEEPPR